MLETRIGICFVISILLSFNTISFCQTGEEVLNYASELYAEADYAQSALELRRILFHTDYKTKECFLLLADCCALTGKQADFFKYYEQAMDLEENDSIRLELKRILVRKHIQFEQPIYALILLNELKDKLSEKESLFYAVAANYLLNNYSESKRRMHELSGFIPAYDSLYVSGIYLKAEKSWERNMNQYSIYSAVLPGAGQMLSGAYMAGADAFFLNMTIFSLAGVMISHLSFLDAFLTCYPLIKRYYLSNIIQAKKAAEEQKEANKYVYYNQLLDYMNEGLNPE